MINEQLLKPEEKAVYALRSLYSRYGYMPYKMSKFEEYDLYVKNKEFLISDGIITFTDARGKLLALKPDVTLSIIKNSKDVEQNVSKVYYNENVYRISKGSHAFKEIMQTGLECIGAIDEYNVTEVVSLAIRSLALLSDEYLLDLSHMGLIDALCDAAGIEGVTAKSFLSAIEQKNAGEIQSLAATGALTEKAVSLAEALLSEYGTIDAAETALAPYLVTEDAKAAFAELSSLVASLCALGLSDRVRLDFSVMNHRGYYSGVVFKGYIKGIPDSVLTGGRYDRMMRRMGRRDGAVGFAVYLDSFASYARNMREYDTDILLLKNNAAVADILSTLERLSADGARVLVADTVPNGIRAARIMIMQGKEAANYGND